MDKLIKALFAKGKCKGVRKKTQPYDLKLKSKIIERYLQGDVSFAMLSKQYKIHPGVMSRWVRVIKEGRPVVESKKISKFTGMLKDQTTARLLEQISCLKRELEEERLRSGLYKKMIEIAERDLGISIEKKYGARRSMNTGKQNKEQQG
jgi:transposase-like protein